CWMFDVGCFPLRIDRCNGRIRQNPTTSHQISPQKIYFFIPHTPRTLDFGTPGEISLKPCPTCSTLPPVRAHGMWTYEPRQGRKAATVVCSTSAVVTLAFFIYDMGLIIDESLASFGSRVNRKS